MRICLFIPSLVSGGAERVITHLANYWAKKGAETYLLTLASPSDTPFYKVDELVHQIHLDLLPRQENPVKKVIRYIKQIIKVTRTIQKISPLVVVAFLDISIFLALIAGVFSKSKIIISERNNPFSSVTNEFLKRINLFLYRFADGIVIQTKQLAQLFPSRLQRNITIIPNPVVKPSTQIQDYSKTFQQKTIVAIGRLHPQKGHDTLIKVFADILNNFPDWQLKIIGEGEERSHLESLLAKYQIQHKASLPGRSSNIEEVLLQSSIFILPSRYEGFPNSLCESMAVGLPVIATNCQFGPQEIIQNRVNGLLVSVDNQHEMVEALTHLIQDYSLYQTIGENAKKITDRLALEHVIKLWEQVIVKSSN